MKNVDEFFAALDYTPKQSLLSTGEGQGVRFAIFLVPASIRILLQLSRDRLKSYASKIDFLETGAAPMMQRDMEELCRVLPDTRLYNTYASTETGIITTYNDETRPPFHHSRRLCRLSGTDADDGLYR